jgi:hypothetical protein
VSATLNEPKNKRNKKGLALNLLGSFYTAHFTDILQEGTFVIRYLPLRIIPAVAGLAYAKLRWGRDCGFVGFLGVVTYHPFPELF